MRSIAALTAILLPLVTTCAAEQPSFANSDLQLQKLVDDAVGATLQHFVTNKLQSNQGHLTIRGGKNFAPFRQFNSVRVAHVEN